MNAIEILAAWQAENGGCDRCRYEIHSPDEGMPEFFVNLEHGSKCSAEGFHVDPEQAAQMAVDNFRGKK